MNQSRLGSFFESLINVVIGYMVALASQLIVFPFVGIHVDFTTNLEIGAWFTLISIIRSYLIRRYFNAHLHKAAQRMAGARNSAYTCPKEIREAMERDQEAEDYIEPPQPAFTLVSGRQVRNCDE